MLSPIYEATFSESSYGFRPGRNVITELNPILRGWAAYFKLTETKRAGRSWMAGSDTNYAASYGDSGNAITLAQQT